MYLERASLGDKSSSNAMCLLRLFGGIQKMGGYR